MNLLLSTLLILPLAGRADLLMPGHKSVQHLLVLTWDDALVDTTFVAFPTQGFHGAHLVEQNVPFSFSTKYGTRIYAVPADAAWPTDREGWLAAPWPSAAVPVVEIRSVPVSNPLERAETKLRITKVLEEGIEFTQIAHRELTATGRELGPVPWLPLVILAALGATFLFRMSRRIRATPNSR